jgi:hypothetical protein
MNEGSSTGALCTKFTLVIVKGIMPFPLVKIFGFEGWSYDNVFHVIFPHFALVETMLLAMVTKTMKFMCSHILLR